MDALVQLNNQSSGRDKLARLLQYSSRFCWYYAQNNEPTSKYVDVLKSLEYTFSSFRKLLRLGRCLDSLYASLSVMSHPDLVMRTTLALSKISNSLFLLADHIIWCTRVGLIRANLDKWNNISNRYWLMTIIMNLARDIYEIMQILECKKTMKRLTSGDVSFIVTDHTALFLDTVKNSCDLWIPLTYLDFTKLNAGTVGLLGCISSAVGIYTLINPGVKLKFA